MVIKVTPRHHFWQQYTRKSQTRAPFISCFLWIMIWHLWMLPYETWVLKLHFQGVNAVCMERNLRCVETLKKVGGLEMKMVVEFQEGSIIYAKRMSRRMIEVFGFFLLHVSLLLGHWRNRWHSNMCRKQINWPNMQRLSLDIAKSP